MQLLKRSHHNIYTYTHRVAYGSTNAYIHNLLIDAYQDDIIRAYNEGALYKGAFIEGDILMDYLCESVNEYRLNNKHTPNTRTTIADTLMLIHQTQNILERLKNAIL